MVYNPGMKKGGYGLNPATFVLGLVALAWLGVKELVEELGWFRRR